ncbi:hypothetical protein LOZ65_006881, partial [Ophidiomyces ophidiicola]
LQAVLKVFALECQKKNHVFVQKELNSCILSIQKTLFFQKENDVSCFQYEDDENSLTALIKRLENIESKLISRLNMKKTKVSAKSVNGFKFSYSDAVKQFMNKSLNSQTSLSSLNLVNENVNKISFQTMNSKTELKNPRENRLIFKVNAKTAEKIQNKAYFIRNRINDAFVTVKITEKPVVSSI